MNVGVLTFILFLSCTQSIAAQSSDSNVSIDSLWSYAATIKSKIASLVSGFESTVDGYPRIKSIPTNFVMGVACTVFTGSLYLGGFFSVFSFYILEAARVKASCFWLLGAAFANRRLRMLPYMDLMLFAIACLAYITKSSFFM